MSSSTTSTPVKRACDGCHRRKVKCIAEGTNTCKNCVAAGLQCTYNAIPQKKGPKGSRAKVLSELRENQRQLLSGLTLDPSFDGVRGPTNILGRTPGLLPPALVESCVEFYFASIYSTLPMLHRQRVRETIMNTAQSTEAYCMITALCAFVMIQANFKPPPETLSRPEMVQMPSVMIGQYMLEESIRVRKGYDYINQPTILSILTSFLYYSCFYNLEKDNAAWTYLREATTQAQLLNMHDEDTYKPPSPDQLKKRALYWLLMVAERTQALHKHRPISLFATINSLQVHEDPSEQSGTMYLNSIVDLFSPFDSTFISLWNKLQIPANKAGLEQLQNQLAATMPAYHEFTDTQAVDFQITQHWLRTQAWQLCMNLGYLSITSVNSCMTFKYPIEISQQLVSVSHQFPHPVMEMHGVGLIEKLFDIACCLIDVIACTRNSNSPLPINQRDCIVRFLNLIETLRGGSTRYVPLLRSKISDLLPDFSISYAGTSMRGGGPSLQTGIPNVPGGLTNLGPHSPDNMNILGSTSSPIHASTDLIRVLAAQTGADIPFVSNNPQHHSHAQQQHPYSMSTPSTSRSVEDPSMTPMYSDSPASSAHPVASGASSQTSTPNPYDTSTHTTHHAQHQQQQRHHGIQQQQQQHGLPVAASAYHDPRFAPNVQGYQMGYEEEDAHGRRHGGEGTGMYPIRGPGPSGGQGGYTR